MQGIRTNRRNLIINIIFVSLLILFVLLDQIIKTVCMVSHINGWEKTTVIENFFYLRFSLNDGAAFGLGGGTSWAQPLFIVITILALIIFYFYYIFACKKNYLVLRSALILIISGTLGNFIDRIVYGKVVDYISLVFGSYHFAIFNLADALLTIGVVILFVHYLFLDNNAIFKRKNDGKKLSDNER